MSGINSPYNFAIPSSPNTVDIHIMKAVTSSTGLSVFIKDDPDLPTTATLMLSSWIFLIEHPKLKRRVLFDLGIRKDLKNLAPAAYQAIARPDGTPPFVIDKDIPELLVDGDVSLESIDTIIWRLVDEPCCSAKSLIAHHLLPS
jgi:hypothetical protein